jgi:hypothetical protein
MTDEKKTKSKAKAPEVPDESLETPSGAALKAVEGIKDPEEKRLAYERAKDAVRRGSVAPEDASKVV